MDAILHFLMDWGYWGIFISGFLSGSILPFASEAVVLSYIYAGLPSVLCILFATAGNSLGGVTCFAIGHLGKERWIDKILHVSDEKLKRAHRFIHGRGAWIAFFSFVPIIGDVLLVALGLSRSNIWIVITAMTIGKLLRYIIIVAGALGISAIFG